MTLLYRTTDGSDTIAEVGVTAVEKNWVTLHAGDRVRRSGLVVRYHDTFAEAKYYLRRLHEIRLKHLALRAEAARHRIHLIDKKTKPDIGYDYTKNHPQTLFHRER